MRLLCSLQCQCNRLFIRINHGPSTFRQNRSVWHYGSLLLKLFNIPVTRTNNCQFFKFFISYIIALLQSHEMTETSTDRRHVRLHQTTAATMSQRRQRRARRYRRRSRLLSAVVVTFTSGARQLQPLMNPLQMVLLLLLLV